MQRDRHALKARSPNLVLSCGSESQSTTLTSDPGTQVWSACIKRLHSGGQNSWASAIKKTECIMLHSFNLIHAMVQETSAL